MRFEKLKKGRKDSKVMKFIEEFVETNYDKVEVFNEDDYPSDNQMIAALRFAAKSYFNDKVKITTVKSRVFMVRTDKGLQK